jgi:NifU-like protein involved in Fe-S cluster formation
MDKELINNPDGVGEAKFQDSKCLDRIRLLIKVDSEKIVRADTIVTGCTDIKKAADFLVKSLKGKTLKGLKVDFSEIKVKHASEIAKKAFERTLENYKKFKNDPLDEIIKITQSYDEGYVIRDPKYDFEY